MANSSDVPGQLRLDDASHIPAREAYCERNMEGWKAETTPPWGSALCKIHDDGTASLRVNLETGGVFCHGCNWKGTITEYAKQCGMPTEGLPKPPAKGAIPQGKTTRYVYTTADGTPHLRVSRGPDKPNGKKNIWQCHWDGKAWAKGKVTPAPLFNAKALAEAPAGSIVYSVEGEKCAQHLIDRGFLATTAPEGAGKFKHVGSDWLGLLLPLGVVILPDHDKGGYSHALQVAERLRKELGIESKVLLLPCLGPKEDVADWLQLPRRAADLVELVPNALTLEEFSSVADSTFSKEEKATLRKEQPTLDGTKVILSGVSGLKAEQILAAVRANNNPLKAFVWGPTEKVSDLRDDGTVKQCSTHENLAHFCERRMGLAFYQESNNGSEYPVDAPEKALKRILGMPAEDTGLPRINEFIEAPVLAADGTLIMGSGLHSTGIYYRPGIDIPPIPSDPSPELVAECLEGLDYLIDDFPFESLEDRQAYYSYLVTGFIAAKAPRPWPLWHFSAPTQGSGKDKLASLPGHIALGKDPGVLPIDSMERSDAEIRKKLTSLLDSNPARWALMGNVKGHLSSPSLEAFLTATEWKDRILGGNKMGNWPITVGLAMTGNNLTLSPDLERRQVLIRLTPDTDQPWLRNDFQIPDLFGYVKQNRAKILWQILVLVQRWVALGFPQGAQRLGSFEGWSAALGGLLECVGIGSNFLSSTRVIATHSDPWQAFVQLWANSYIENSRQPASELCRFVEESGVRLSEGSPALSLGKKLAKQVSRVFSIDNAGIRAFVRLTSDKPDRSKKGTWTLESVNPGQRRQVSRQNNLRISCIYREPNNQAVPEDSISGLSPATPPASPAISCAPVGTVSSKPIHSNGARAQNSAVVLADDEEEI